MVPALLDSAVSLVPLKLVSPDDGTGVVAVIRREITTEEIERGWPIPSSPFRRKRGEKRGPNNELVEHS